MRKGSLINREPNRIKILQTNPSELKPQFPIVFQIAITFNFFFNLRSRVFKNPMQDSLLFVENIILFGVFIHNGVCSKERKIVMICRNLRCRFVPSVARKFENLNVWGSFLGFFVFIFLLKISRAFSCKMIGLEFWNSRPYISHKFRFKKNEEWSLKIDQIVVSCFFFKGLWCYVFFCSTAIIHDRINKFLFFPMIAWKQFLKWAEEKVNFFLPVSITNV